MDYYNDYNDYMNDFNDGFGEIDYPDEPEFGYETDQMMSTLGIDYEVLDYGEDDIKEAIILHSSQRLEEYVLNENIEAAFEILKNGGLVYIDDWRQTDILQVACCHCCPSMVELLCKYDICGDNWANFEETFSDFEKAFDNFKIIVEMKYFYKIGEWLLYCLWESDTLPRRGRRRIVNYLNEVGLLTEVQDEYLKKEIKNQFDRQFLPSLETKFPFGVSHTIANYMCA